MEPVQVGERTYYFAFSSIIGVYLLKGGKCCLIDSGERLIDTKTAVAELNDRGYMVSDVLSTHFHPDHCAGHQYLVEKVGCRLWASFTESLFLENPILSPLILYGATPFRVLKNRFLMGSEVKVTRRVEPGVTDVDGSEFTVLDLRGHTAGQLGWMTPDKVLFVGDSLLPPHVLAETGFNYFFDIEAQRQTLARLKSIQHLAVISGHGIIDDLALSLKQNELLIDQYLNFIVEEISQGPLTVDDLAARVIFHFGLPVNHSQYFLIRSTVAAYIAYLHNNRKITSQIRDGKVVFFLREEN